MNLSESRTYQCRGPLVLVNELAEQAESWFANRAYWAQYSGPCHMPL